MAEPCMSFVAAACGLGQQQTVVGVGLLSLSGALLAAVTTSLSVTSSSYGGGG